MVSGGSHCRGCAERLESSSSSADEVHQMARPVSQRLGDFPGATPLQKFEDVQQMLNEGQERSCWEFAIAWVQAGTALPRCPKSAPLCAPVCSNGTRMKEVPRKT